MPDKLNANRKGGKLLVQLAVLFAVGVVVTGCITYIVQIVRTDKSVREQVEIQAGKIGDETMCSFRQYPAYEWLIRYCYDHYDELDIEYDADYRENVLTVEKCRLLAEHVPGIQIEYVTEEQLLEMDEADQKLYAEILYSWIITRLDQIKQNYNIDYLFCVLTDETFSRQFFMMSAADEGASRGTDYKDVYTIGVQVDVSEGQQEAMQKAVEGDSYLVAAGDYVDYYMFIDRIDDRFFIMGMTYNLSGLRNSILTQTWKASSYAMLFQVFLSAICLVMTYLLVIYPLRKVQKNIRLYKINKDSEAVAANLAGIRTRNEIGELSEDVTSLTGEIDNYLNEIRTITAENERIGTELELATRIQTSMLPNIFPPFPERSEFDLYAVMDPAREVGGDFYDFFLVDDDHLCMVMADVSGKGVPAALFMMASKIIIKNNAMSGKSPAQILETANKTICSNNQEDMFVTVWLGILEISTGRLICSNAGHEYPVFTNDDGVFELYKDKHGFVIGAMDTVKYSEYEITMKPGARLFVYTDGVPEATAGEEKMFGTSGMIDSLNSVKDRDVTEVINGVLRDMDEFVKGEEQFDDITMLCMQYFGKDN